MRMRKVTSMAPRRSRPPRLPARFDTEDLRSFADTWAKECGRRINQRRDLFGLHRRQLADLCGVTESTIIRIEDGDQTPREWLRLAIAGALRCEVADLWPYPSCERIHEMAQAVA
jgi:DNA-binding XRE family transcriptional regulator